MLSVIRVHLPSEIPIVGCELTPYVLVRRPDKTAATDDVPESSPLEGYFLRYRWYYHHKAPPFTLIRELGFFGF